MLCSFETCAGAHTPIFDANANAVFATSCMRTVDSSLAKDQPRLMRTAALAATTPARMCPMQTSCIQASPHRPSGRWRLQLVDPELSSDSLPLITRPKRLDTCARIWQTCKWPGLDGPEILLPNSMIQGPSCIASTTAASSPGSSSGNGAAKGDPGTETASAAKGASRTMPPMTRNRMWSCSCA